MATAIIARERPILFSSEMVRAILAGRKTQTRRIVRGPVKVVLPTDVHGDFPIGHMTIARGGTHEAILNPHGAVCVRGEDGKLLGVKPDEFEWICPYGAAGDRIWVRETFLVRERGSHVIYRASLDDVDAAGIGAMYGGWKPSIFMPRSVCRIELEIVSRRIESVQDIDEFDAECEGLYRGAARRHLWWRSPGLCRLVEPYRDHKRAFADLWDEINFKRAPWSSNPLVWRIEFRVVDSSRPTEAASQV